jgi:hypothetical protein
VSDVSPADRVGFAREAQSRARKLKDLMVAVATSGPEIKTVNHEYVQQREELAAYLRALGVQGPRLFDDLWGWYGRWSSGDMPTYQARRVFLGELFAPLLDALGRIEEGAPEIEERPPTGWARVDRGIEKMREALERARDEEDHQAVGHLGREILISLAQAVYNRDRHPPLDGIEPSPTDAKRMLDAVFAVELAGGTHHLARQHARSALDLANELTHKRTAEFRLAALCAEVVASVCNQTAIVVGRRDPGPEVPA